MSSNAPLPIWGSLLLAAGPSLAGSSTTKTAASGSLTTAAAFAGDSTTRTAASGALSVAGVFAGDSTTRTSGSGSLTTAAAFAGTSTTTTSGAATFTPGTVSSSFSDPLAPMPLPMWWSLGGASPPPTVYANAELSGAGIDPWWKLRRAQALTDAAAAFSGTSTTRTSAAATLTPGEMTLAGSSTTRTYGSATLTVGGAMFSGTSTTRTSALATMAANAAPSAQMPLPHLSLLGGASPVPVAWTNTDLTGAGIDPWWKLRRVQGLLDNRAEFSGTSVTRTSASGRLTDSVTPPGISSAQALGSMGVTRLSIRAAVLSGIPSAEAMGTPSVATPDAATVVNAGAIASAEVFGVPDMLRERQAPLAMAGISSGEAMGPAVIGATISSIVTPNPDIEASRISAFRARRAAIAAEPVLLGRTELDPVLTSQALAPQQPRKMAGAVVLDPVSADYASGFEVWNVVSADYSGSFGTQQLVSADYSGSMAVQSFSHADYAGEFETLAVVGQECSGTFDVLAEVSADFSGSFLSDGLLSAVDADYAGSFDVLADVGQEWDGSFAVLGSVDADYAGSFDVTSAVAADYAGSFDVLQLVHADYEGFYVVGLFGRGVTMVPPPYDGRMVLGEFANIMVSTE